MDTVKNEIIDLIKSGVTMGDLSVLNWRNSSPKLYEYMR